MMTTLPPHVIKALKLTLKGSFLDVIKKEGSTLTACDFRVSYYYTHADVAALADGYYTLKGTALVRDDTPMGTYLMESYTLAGKACSVDLPAHAFAHTVGLVDPDTLYQSRAGVLVHIDALNSELRTVGTDGHMLGISRFALTGKHPTEQKAHIEHKAARLHELHGPGILSFTRTVGEIDYSTGEVIRFRLVDANFPEYDFLFYPLYTHRHRLVVEEFIGAIDRLGKPVKGKSWVVAWKDREWSAYVNDDKKGIDYDSRRKLLVEVPEEGDYELVRPIGTIIMPINSDTHRRSSLGEICFDAYLFKKALLNSDGYDVFLHTLGFQIGALITPTNPRYQSTKQAALNVRTKQPLKKGMQVYVVGGDEMLAEVVGFKPGYTTVRYVYSGKTSDVRLSSLTIRSYNKGVAQSNPAPSALLLRARALKLKLALLNL